MRSARALAVVTGLVMGAVLFGPATPACACSCAQVDLTESFAEADVVFVGVVSDVDRPWSIFGGSSADPVRVSLDVTLVHKGEVTASVQVTTEADGASCGYPFVKSHRYLVFARSERDGRALGTNLCSGNQDLATFADPFGAGVPPAPNHGDRERWWLPWVAAGAGAVVLALLVLTAVRVRSRRGQKLGVDDGQQV